jgi:hypothetical protein
MGSYLEDYRARVGTWAARTTWRTAQGNAQVVFCLGAMILCATTSAVLFVIDGVEKNPGPGVEVEKILQVLCSGCDRNLKSRTQCNTRGCCFHNSYGNVKSKLDESGKWM